MKPVCTLVVGWASIAKLLDLPESKAKESPLLRHPLRSLSSESRIPTMSTQPELPERVRDTKLEFTFERRDNLDITIHVRSRGRRATRETWVRDGALGRGGFGFVWREHKLNEISTPTNELRAVKEIWLTRSQASDGEYVRELDALAKFSQDKVKRASSACTHVASQG